MEYVRINMKRELQYLAECKIAFCLLFTCFKIFQVHHFYPEVAVLIPVENHVH